MTGQPPTRPHGHTPSPFLVVLWTTLYTTAALLLAWSREGVFAWWLAALVVGGIGAIIAYKGYGHITRRAAFTAACFFLLLGALAPAPVAWQLRRLTTEWESLQAQRDASTRRALDRQVQALLELGTATVAEVAGTNGQFATAARKTAAQNARLLELQRSLFDELETIATRSKVDAVAMFSDSGELYAWAGEHRGKIPEDVRNGADDILFVERPLYSYLYFIRPHESGHGRAVAAILLDVALPSESDQQTVRNQTRLLGGRSPFFQHGPGNPGDWSLIVGVDTVLHARLEPPSQEGWRHELLRAAQRIQMIVLIIAVLLLSITWFREPARTTRFAAAVPFYGIAAALITTPIGGATGLGNIFSPGYFLLPGPGTVSLGTLFVVMMAAGVFVSTARPRTRLRHTLLFIVGACALALLLPIAIQVLIGPAALPLRRWSAPSATLLESTTPLWAGLQIALVLLFAVMIAAVLMIARLPARLARRRRHGTSLLLLAIATGTSAVISVALLLLSRDREIVSPWIASLWLIPILAGGFGAAAYQRDGRRLVGWLIAGWIAGTIVLPYLWIANVNSRLRSAERELLTLGSRPDPYLDFLLRGFGREAIARRERGEDDLQLLYRSWVASGLAREAYPVRLMMWDSLRHPYVQLPLGDAFTSAADRVEVMPQYLDGMFLRVQELAHPDVFAVPNADDVIQVLVVPLDQGRMITVEVPPRRSFERANAIAPLLGSRADLSTRLDLVAAQGNTIVGGIWRRTKTGWRSEEIVPFPDAEYHAHLEVAVPRTGVQLARGTIIVAADLLLLLLVWLAGRALRNEAVSPAGGWFGWLGSFRARVTAALFAFFLLPTVIFGWVAYRAVAREVVRAARIVAERTVKQAVAEFPSQTDLRALAEHASAEVLIYDFQGEIQSVSSLEALELGVYSAWMPSDIYLDIESGEEEGAVAPRTIGDQQFLTAFHALVPRGTGTMAVPISLESGETEVRQREMAHLILFAALMGGLLSLALSLAVGRALAGPIGKLQRAAAAIGAGRLNVQLPEQPGDEFGRLYASFNRMVRRLRRARGQEVRTARVLAWGEMARQVAHEIKNPLTPIKLSVQHLRRAYGDRRPDFEQVLNQSVDQILIEIDRLTEIARAFSRYGAPLVSAGPLEPVNVGSVVHEAMTLYRTGDPQLSYVDDIEPGLPPVLARGGELKEVILNLLENARAATDPGGRIAVVAKRDHTAIELCVQDTGVGIPAEQLARIFEPHFSTRTAGTGLGLAIVRRLVESWGGSVDAESKPGRGTIIRVRLQIANGGEA